MSRASSRRRRSFWAPGRREGWGASAPLLSPGLAKARARTALPLLSRGVVGPRRRIRRAVAPEAKLEWRCLGRDAGAVSLSGPSRRGRPTAVSLESKPPRSAGRLPRPVRGLRALPVTGSRDPDKRGPGGDSDTSPRRTRAGWR